MVVQISQLK